MSGSHARSLLLLLALGGLLPAAAPAQAPVTYAQATEQPGRIVLTPFSVGFPAGADWALVRRSDSALVFSRPATDHATSRVAQVSSVVPERSVRTAAELETWLRQQIERADPARFELLDVDIRAAGSGAPPCLRYAQFARDRQALDGEGEAQTIHLEGQACAHPQDAGLILQATLSERGPLGQLAADLGEQAERFFAGIRPHAILQGSDWQPLAAQGDANAQVWLARALLQTAKPEQGIAWLEKAAAQGQVDAQALLGLARLTGRGIERQPAQAVAWLEKAAAQGYPKAKGLLALAYLDSVEIRDEARAFRWARVAADDGDPLGQALLGELLLSGRHGVARDAAAAARWLHEAARQGEARSQYLYADLLMRGIGVAARPGEARFWLELAAAQGHAEARERIDNATAPDKNRPAAR